MPVNVVVAPARSALFETAAIAAGMVLFALFANRGAPWVLFSVLGLIVVAATCARALSSSDSPGQLLGFVALTPRIAIIAGVGLVLGIAFAILHRTSLGMSALPTGGIQPFVIIACAVGICEELLYRGLLLGRLATLRWPVAVLVVAIAHALYKTALFATPAAAAEIDLPGILLVTIAGGVVLGGIRIMSRSIVPSMLAHAAFDFVVYGSLATAPWWVW